jgi:hypothetical protein
MANELKYTHNKYSVFASDVEIARSYVSDEHGGNLAVRVLQGVPRMEVWDKIFEDCPDFAKDNEMDRNKVPYLFGGSKKK